jgi:tetratricopeptide (TPR) repeat protein
MQEAIRLRPDFIRARQALERLNEGGNLPGALNFNAAGGDVQATLGGTAQSDAVRRRYEEALTTLQSESEKHPERLDLMQQLGNAAGRAGKYDLAIYTYQRLLDRMDQGSEARGEIYLRLGETYRRKGDAGGAIQALEKAKELIPGNRAVFANLELALDAAGRHTEATRMREEAATTQNNQVTLTTNFLREELASAEKLLESLRSQPQPATEALRQVESRVQEIKSKLASAIVVRAASAVTLHLGDMPEAMKQDLLKYLQAREGDTLTGAVAGATLAAAKEYDESLDVRYGVMDDGRIQLVITKPRK